MSMNLLLDFDGVLFDSSWEVTVIILTTFLNAFPNSNISKYLNKSNTYKVLNSLKGYLPNHALKIIQNENMKLNHYFRKFRTYCIDIDDFFVISYLIDINFFDLKNLNYKTINHEFYYNFKNKILLERKEELNLFIKTFYESRKYIKDSSEQFWIMLNQPFENEIDILLKIHKKVNNIGILSTKQRYAILSILHFYNIPINPDFVFAKQDEPIHKGKKIKEIIDLWGIKENTLHFVDDLLENLIKVKNENIGVNLYMSMWGYNNYYHRILAKKNGIVLINSLEYLLKLIK